MKMYCAMLINEITGEIEQCITSDAPITSVMIPMPQVPSPELKTIPPTPPTTYRKCFCEFESDTFARGNEAISSIEMTSKSKSAKARIKTGKKIKNLKETTETDMALDYAALQASKL